MTNPAIEMMDLLSRGGRITFQTFPDRVEDKAQEDLRRKLTSVRTGTFMQVGAYLRQMNRQRAGIFHTVNETDGKGRKMENIVGVRSYLCEIDGIPSELDKEDAISRLLKAECPVSIVVETRNGIQGYWLAHEGEDIAHVRAINEGLIEFFGGDNNAKDVSRVLRTPGFYHVKGDPFWVKVRHLSDLRYTAGELAAAYPPPEPKQPKRSYSDTYTPPSDANYALVGGLISHLLPLWGQGGRHELALAAAAKMWFWGVPESDAMRAIERICGLSGDSELDDRLQAVRDTYRSANSGQQVSTFELKHVTRRDLLN